MTFENLLSFNIVLILSIVSPGPALLFFVSSSLNYGKAGALRAGLGLGAMAAMWTFLALLGLNTIFTLFPALYFVVKTLGALYLIRLAVVTWMSADKEMDVSAAKSKRIGISSGVLINLANPKSVLFAASVLVLIFPQNLTLFEKLVITANHFVLEIAFYSTIALVLTNPAVSKRYFSIKKYFDRLSAAVLGALGLKLLFED